MTTAAPAPAAPTPLAAFERFLVSSAPLSESAPAESHQDLAAFVTSPDARELFALTAECFNLRDRYQFTLKRARILDHLDKALATAKDNAELLRTASLMTSLLYRPAPRFELPHPPTPGEVAASPRPEGATPSRTLSTSTAPRTDTLPTPPQPTHPSGTGVPPASTPPPTSLNTQPHPAAPTTPPVHKQALSPAPLSPRLGGGNCSEGGPLGGAGGDVAVFGDRGGSATPTPTHQPPLAESLPAAEPPFT